MQKRPHIICFKCVTVEWLQKFKELAAIPVAHGRGFQRITINTRMVRAKVTSAAMASTRIAIAADLFLPSSLLPKPRSPVYRKRWPCYQNISKPACTHICMENSIVEQTLLAECRNPTHSNWLCFFTHLAGKGSRIWLVQIYLGVTANLRTRRTQLSTTKLLVFMTWFPSAVIL